jgi:hypothetical protein
LRRAQQLRPFLVLAYLYGDQRSLQIAN